MLMLTIFVLYLKYPFLVNLVPKFIISFLKRNLVSRIIEICRLNYGVCFICFWLEIPCLGKFCAKNQNCQFKLIFSTQINSNMKNSMKMLIFSVFDKMYPFSRNLFQKIKIVFDLNMQNLMMIFFFFFPFQVKSILFWVNLVHKFKISKPVIIVSRNPPSFWFPWSLALVCNSTVFIQNVICY